ncbi:MAG: EthD family reductase [Gammaproteobacteria bacterium]|nr:EthD family reductase [Gammaproteobacteria bacterium]
MLAFCAYYKGNVKTSEAEFDAYIQSTHLPLVAKYPRLQQLRFLKGVARDGNPPGYYLSFELFFKNWDDFEIAKKSEERQIAVEDALKLAEMFDGEIHHVVYELQEIPVAS